MNISELPRSTSLTVSTDMEKIENAIERVFRNAEGTSFYTSPIEGAPQSGRIISRTPYPGGLLMPDTLSTAEDMAMQLLALTVEARYPLARTEGSERGWEICEASLRGHTVAIAWATWVKPQ